MSPITIINHFEIAPDKIDAFVEAQLSFAASLCDRPSGLIGGRLYRGLDGRSAVLVSQFESREAQERIRASDAFQQHIARLKTLIVSTSPKFYEEAYTTGTFT
jgi:quinol monooxygenase YgiN